jgi:hypothetical protein
VVSHEHAQELRPQDEAFPAWLDAMSAQGWELAAMAAVGAVQARAVLVGGQPSAVPLVSCVFRRARGATVAVDRPTTGEALALIGQSCGWMNDVTPGQSDG